MGIVSGGLRPDEGRVMQILDKNKRLIYEGVSKDGFEGKSRDIINRLEEVIDGKN